MTSRRKDATLVDLSVQISDGMPVHALFPSLEHVGTHVDAPLHIKEGGQPIDEVVTNNPGLTADATHWLADRGLRVHGVEGPSTDKGGSPLKWLGGTGSPVRAVATL